MFSSIGSSGPVHYSTDRLAASFWPEFGENSIQAHQNTLTSLLKRFQWRSRNAVLTNLPIDFLTKFQSFQLFLPEVQSFLAHHPNSEKNSSIFSKKKKSYSKLFFPKWFIRTLTRQFWQRCPQVISLNFENVLPKIQKKTNKKLFDFRFLKKLLWRDRIQFWQTYRCFHFREPKNFTLKIRKQKTNY